MAATARLSKKEKAAARLAVKSEARREGRKVQRHQRTERLRQQWASLSDEEREQARLKIREERRLVEERLEHGLAHGLNVCIDLSYESEHTEKEKRSLCKQLQLAYSVLRKSQVPIHLHVTSMGGLSQQTSAAISAQGFDGWKVDRHLGQPWSVFGKERIVYLSPDAREPLARFEDDKVYVIGGIVDRSVRKAVTLNTATEQDIEVRRLPIQEFVPERESHILNIDAVLATICKFREAGEDWAQTLKTTMPLRKQAHGGKQKRRKEVEEQQEEEEEEDEEEEGERRGKE